jgi:multiple sugar transport system substrate-binding protein
MMKIEKLLRSVVLLLLGVAVPMGLISCGTTTDAAKPTVINFWVRENDKAFTIPLVQAYNETHTTKVKLTVITAESFVTKFGTAIAAGTPPDVIAIDLIYLPAFNAANQMVDITDLAHSLPFFDKLSHSHVRLATAGGKIYGLPYSADGSVLLYNKTLFRQAGLDPNAPPVTWADIEADSQKITALGDDIKGFYFSGRCAGCNAFTILPLIWASGGDVLSSDSTTATIDSPAVRNVLEFYHRLWVGGQMPQAAKTDNGDHGANFIDAFTTGKIGMIGGGAFSAALLKAQYPKIDFGVTYLPGINGGVASFAGGDTIGIPRGSLHTKEAFDFISWCLSTQTQVELLAKNSEVPVRSDLGFNKYSQKDTRYVTISKAFAQGRTPDTVHYNQLFNDANGPWITTIENAVFNGQIDSSLATAQQQFTQILSTTS